MSKTETAEKTPDFRELREQIISEIERLRREHRALEEKILSLRHSLKGIDRYLEAEQDRLRFDPVPLDEKWAGLREKGLTDAVRMVIQNSLGPVNATEIRDELIT